MVQEKWHLEDWQSFGVSYAKTLRAWKDNLKNWKGLEEFDERFHRMWALRSALELCNVPIFQEQEKGRVKDHEHGSATLVQRIGLQRAYLSRRLQQCSCEEKLINSPAQP
jgi:hypothetical protein